MERRFHRESVRRGRVGVGDGIRKGCVGKVEDKQSNSRREKAVVIKVVINGN